MLELGWAVRDARTGGGYVTELGRAALAAGIIRRDGLVEGRTGIHPDAPFAVYRL
ncbi:hypothetical protein Pa4123_81270 [Phytohabitans aurantiacus]|uniref:Uncharacterized protein n=1 Tax=Phytohabitans aurantiacus TaxID=3016789 RepID=A0ABQ5R7W1_9ACTN|nr:hypothetical protein Pa4123_81270 [Phytohabitans aurantiacus]